MVNTNPFHMSKEMMDSLLDDYEHRVKRIIENYGDRPDFPNVERYKITKDELEDYLFDYQAILDSEGTERSRYTIGGIIIIIPIVVLAFLYPVNKMPFGQWTMLLAILAGLFLWGAYTFLRKMLLKMRIEKLNKRNANVRQYVEDILAYHKA